MNLLYLRFAYPNKVLTMSLRRFQLKHECLRMARMAVLYALGVCGLIGSVSAAPSEQPLGCLIQPDQVTELGSPVVGLLEQVHVDRGDWVEKGQILATLSAEVERAFLGVATSRAEATADLRAAVADLAYHRQRLARAEDLRKQNFISDQALDQNRSEALLSQERLAQAREQQRHWEREFELAQAQLDQRQIRSPFDGVVMERYRSPGERIENRPILKLASLDPLRVEVFMPASRYGSMEIGMPLTVVPELNGTAPLEAEVVRVDRVIDPASNTFRVQLRLPNPDQTLPAGLRCRVHLEDAPPLQNGVTPSPPH
jgi:RND family efflux transporter MFP subunit